MKDLCTLGWDEAAKRMDAGQLSSVELVGACLDQIAHVDDQIKAWRWVDAQAALQEAERADALRAQGKILGPLHGLPLGVKDIIDTVLGGTEYGSPIYAGHRPRSNAACVSRAKQAGAIILGKTHTTEFAYFRPAPTRHPQAIDHTPGGSSSGSAAGVAAQMVPVALGTQTAASVIRPASFCGVVGYKASWGDFSLAGIKPFAHSLDSLGFMARQVGDVQRLRSALLAPPYRLTVSPRPPQPDASTLQIWLCRGPHWDQAQPESQAAVLWAAQTFRQAGATVQEVTLPEGFDQLTEAQKTIMAFEAAQSLASDYQDFGEQLSPQIRELIESGRGTTWSVYQKAQALAHQCQLAFSRWLSPGCLILTPSAMGEAPAGLHATGDPLFSRMWTLLHVPSLSLPGYRGPQGLPVGVQLIAAWRQDDDLLRQGRTAQCLIQG
jgi:amidase